MGLSAVVFKSAARLKNEYSREFEITDEETGEATPDCAGPDAPRSRAELRCEALRALIPVAAAELVRWLPVL